MTIEGRAPRRRGRPRRRGSTPRALGLAGGVVLIGACAIRLPAEGANEDEGIPCQAAMECPQPDNPCLLAYCMEQQCVHVPSPDGQLPEEAQQPGDCQQQYCDGNGQVVPYPAAYDVPKDDDNPCTEERCEGTTPKHAPKTAGVGCGDDGICNGAGKCGVCLPKKEECQGHAVRSCSAAGQWSEPEACGSTEPVCSGARCVALGDVTLGRAHGCARFGDGSVRCWGSSADGRLGQGGPAAARSPSWGTGFRGTAIGARHGCALDGSGSIWCWGAKDFGQLGNGGYQSSAGPARAGAGQALAVVVGESHSCALDAAGAVQCWGRNDRGQLGSGKAPAAPFADRPGPSSSGSAQAVPQAISGLTGVTTLELPSQLTCVRVGATPPRCWGAVRFPLPTAIEDTKELAKLEKGTMTSPTEVAGLPPSRQLVAGDHFTCALAKNGSVHCWGTNDSGQLGDGTRNGRFKPAPVLGLANARALAAGAGFACALLTDRSVQCWGANEHGQLGSGKRGPALRPSPIAGLGGVQKLLAGESFACAWQQNGPLVCWGAGGSGQLGNGATDDAPRPVPVRW